MSSNVLLKKYYFEGDPIAFMKGKMTAEGRIKAIKSYTFIFQEASGGEEEIGISSLIEIVDTSPSLSRFERNGKQYYVREFQPLLGGEAIIKPALQKWPVQRSEIIPQARFKCDCIVHYQRPDPNSFPPMSDPNCVFPSERPNYSRPAIVLDLLARPMYEDEFFDLKLSKVSYIPVS
ncbi:hypothetical protein [Pseudomonas sp. 58(2021)]|uniref:hypothetical protein n=1 Tax=Pseudomonas sp. 58(2021) TaxID=2813330 RepID=UPI001A9CB910|nr:hypothetical protein [Pseudomonas sp. 58(2021)]